MPLETATYISQLVATNPATGDAVAQGDDHLRLIKAVLQAQFPNFTAVALNSTEAAIDAAVTGTINSTTLTYASDATAGFTRSSAGHQTITGVLRGNGAVPVGSLHDFPIDPGSTLVARGGTAAGTEQYIELDGSTYNNTTFPDLATFLGQGGSTFTLPDCKTTGRFRRSRTSSVTVGTTQSNQNAAHTHGVSTITTTSNGAHTHTATDAGHTHAVTGGIYGGTSNVGDSLSGSSITLSITPTNVVIATGFASISVASNGAHTHTLTGNTDSQGGTEARPESFVVMMTIKT